MLRCRKTRSGDDGRWGADLGAKAVSTLESEYSRFWGHELSDAPTIVGALDVKVASGTGGRFRACKLGEGGKVSVAIGLGDEL